jgi:nitric oxide reductase subunit B
VQQRLGNGDAWYWFGHQGWEYVDLGRFWQIFLFVGLFVWLFLTARSIWPALKKPSEGRPLIVLFVISSVAIAAFYGAGLMYGQRSHLAVVEYWRWWVVHLWVEGFFEVFATVVMAFLFTRLGVLSARVAAPAVLFTTIIFLAGGIIGTFHHLYFTGTPASALGLGATFSALEIVPLVLVGREVWSHIRLSRVPGWLEQYRWPILFFISVAFWNLVGAGVFGFLINPPLALYYMQGLNLTPVHGHTALFGVYGMLGIALMLFSLRMMQPEAKWRTRTLAWSFWALNGGLVLMVVLSMLPIGFLQTQAAIEQGTWWARSAEFLQTPLMDTLRWLRAPGDTVFALGAVLLAWFVIGLKTGWSLERTGAAEAPRPLPVGLSAPAHTAVVRRR